MRLRATTRTPIFDWKEKQHPDDVLQFCWGRFVSVMHVGNAPTVTFLFKGAVVI